MIDSVNDSADKSEQRERAHLEEKLEDGDIARVFSEEVPYDAENQSLNEESIVNGHVADL